jgi:putative addiction module CopG family antidote
MSVNLSPEVNQLIAQELALGHYSSEDELLTEAVHLLSQRNSLRNQIAAGSQQLEAGQYTDYDSQSLRQRFDDLKAGKKFNARRDS